MIHILIVSSDSKFSEALSSVLKTKREARYLRADSGKQGLSMIKDNDFHLVVTDEKLNAMTGLEFLEKLVSVNPMLNCAAASNLSHDEFHEASEGLGLLMSLPLEPKAEHVNKLMEHLQNILQQTIGNKPVIQ